MMHANLISVAHLNKIIPIFKLKLLIISLKLKA